MAIIKPFKGIRPPQNLVEQVASRPYDVLNSEEARAEAEGNEKSLYHIIKPEIDFPVGMDEHDERVYAKAAENFQLFQDKGWLVQDNKENYYIYAQTMNGKTQYGLVVGAYVPDYMNGIIKKHELTRRDKEEDRMKQVRVNNADILFGLLTRAKTLRLSPPNLLKCLLFILLTGITVLPLLHWWEQRKQSKIRIIVVMKNIITSWLFASLQTS